MVSKREAWLDGLKGFAILLVILGHVLSGYLDAWAFPDAYASFYHVRTWIYSFHMPLFFILSGYTFTLAYYRDGKLRAGGFFRQMFNLFWIYTLFALLQWWTKQLVPDLVNEAYDENTLRNMYLEPLGNYWYLYVLFIFYGLAALIRLPRWNPLWFLLFGASAVVAADACMDWTQLTLYRIIYHLPFFMLGSILCRNKKLLKNPQLLGISAMFLSVAAVLYILLYNRNWYGNWQYLIALYTSYVMLWQFYRFPRLSGFPLFRLCGKHCLELYLLHTFFTAGLRPLLPLWGITTPWLSVWVNFLISTGLSLLLAVLAGKIPAMDMVFRPARLLGRLIKKK